MMPSMWEKASTSYSRRLSEQDRAVRKLSLRRVSCKAHPQLLQLLVELYYCALPHSYDDPSSDTLVLCLENNPSISDAMENRILSAFDDEGDLKQESAEGIGIELMRLAEEALTSVDRFYTSATRIRIRTADDSDVMYTASEENELIFPVPELPRSITSLRPITTQITSLQRLGPAGRLGLSEGIDRVLWNGNDGVFAFKRVGRDANMTNHEIELLIQTSLRGPGTARTLKVSAVVIDAQGRLRGFLSPFEPYGSLEEVFTNRRSFPPPALEASGDAGSIVFPRQLEWSEKLRWAAQLARAVASLHDGSPTFGPLTLRNLNPRNVLVSGRASASSSKDTYLTIAGFRGAASPTGMRYFRRWAAPERWRRSSYEIGTALDVANLGMVLWALAEEKFDGFPNIYSEVRRDSSASTTSRRGVPVQQGHSDLWTRDNPPTPGWYRLLVESCVEEQPARRPKAGEVAVALERHLQFLG